MSLGSRTLSDMTDAFLLPPALVRKRKEERAKYVTTRGERESVMRQRERMRAAGAALHAAFLRNWSNELYRHLDTRVAQAC
jgi:hypothetical protein